MHPRNGQVRLVRIALPPGHPSRDLRHGECGEQDLMLPCLAIRKKPRCFDMLFFLWNCKGQKYAGIHHNLHRRPPNRSATAPSPNTGPLMDSKKADSFSIHSRIFNSR